MIVSIVAAMTEGERGIGLRGRLPWRLPADMSRFRKLTMGHAVVMGRVTWEPIAERGLDGRRVIVVTRSRRKWETAHARAGSLRKALEIASKNGRESEAFIAGGSQIYKEALERELVNRMYLTMIHAQLEADAFFPEYDPQAWTTVESTDRAADDRNPYPMTFIILERKNT